MTFRSRAHIRTALSTHLCIACNISTHIRPRFTKRLLSNDAHYIDKTMACSRCKRVITLLGLSQVIKINYQPCIKYILHNFLHGRVYLTKIWYESADIRQIFLIKIEIIQWIYNLFIVNNIYKTEKLKIQLLITNCQLLLIVIVIYKR